MRAADLEVGIVLTGREFTGTIVACRRVRRGHFVLEDVFGHTVMVGVYYPKDDPQGGSSARRAQIDFPLGRHLCFADPSFKLGVDGKPFVRIDKPSDNIAFIPDRRPADGVAWHAPGNEFDGCKHSSIAAARECWSRALRLLGGTAATLLSNRAEARLGIKSAAPGALDAGAALLLDPNNQKAAFRLAKALSQMPNQRDSSRALARLFIDSFPEAKASFESLLARTRGFSAEDEQWCASGPWWEDEAEMSFLAAEASLPLTAPAMTSSAAAAKGDSDAPRSSQWEKLKEKGNKCFRQSRFKQAAAAYSQALHALPETETLVTLLCSLAIMNGSNALGPLGDST
jgi:hypothetical protein